MLELEFKEQNDIKIIRVKSWDFSHGFIDKSLDFKLNDKAWDKFSKTELLLLNQVHGKEIVDLDSRSKNNTYIDADGWISTLDKLDSKNLSLGIKTADCSPVILYAKSKNLVAVLHCGWRSAYAGILNDCIERFFSFGVLASEIEIAIGPAAQGDSYEVGLDLVEKFQSSKAIKKIEVESEDKKENKYYLSIPDFLTSQAKALDVRKVISSNICTMKDENYFSYRRQGNESGRQMSFVG